MKNYYSLTSLLSILCGMLFSLNAAGQTGQWFEPESTWTYNFGIATGPEHYSSRYILEGPLEIDGQEAYKMVLAEGSMFHFCSAPLDPPFYFYEENDSIYYTTEQDGPFYLLFDFSAEVGDSWNVEFTSAEGSGYITYTVLQKEIENTGGEDLIKLTLEGTAPESTGIVVENPVVVYETMGATSYFFAPLGHFATIDCATTAVLQCFESPSFSYLNPSFENCELATGIASVKKQSLTVFPNPVVNKLEISSDALIRSVRIVDLRGRLGLEKAVEAHLVKMDVSSLPAGIYFLVAQTDEGPIKTKFTKE